MLTIGDYLISLCLQYCETMTDEDLATADKLSDCLFRLWKELGLSLKKIKLHCILAHLMPVLKQRRGLKEFEESFCEQDHQSRKKAHWTNKRFEGLP